MTGPHPEARELGMELANRHRSPLRYGFPAPAARAGHELSGARQGPPPPVQPPATNPRPARWHSRARSASLSSHAWRIASCWAGDIEHPWRIPAKTSPTLISERPIGDALWVNLTATYRTQFSDGFQNSRRTRPATALTGDYHGSGTPIALKSSGVWIHPSVPSIRTLSQGS